MIDTNISRKIIEAIAAAQEGNKDRMAIYTDPSAIGKHEFLFFIKPEICLKSEEIQLDKILEMIFQKLDSFKLSIKNIILLPADYLKEHAIIAQHYGVINSLARDVKGNLNASARKRFETEFNIPFDTAPVYGGLEFLAKYPELTPTSLDYLWQNSPTVKLGGGAYGQSLRIDGEPVYLVNGFHGRQLEHFIMPGRAIVAFTLCGDLDWSVARNQLIGKTNPADAEEGSIRGTLLKRQKEFGLQAVNSSWNGVHLSAGPIEGLVELIRYNSDFSSSKALNHTAFSLGKQLETHFDQETVQTILSNRPVNYKGKSETIFDLTEEKNVVDALAILKEVWPKK